MMPGRFLHFLLLLLLLAAILPTHGQLITTDNNQSLIDQILHVVWEPSSLIRMWVGLDQLFNIVRSWRGVAKKLASLPFGGDGESHVRIQEPRSSYRKSSVGSQIDRFNQMYSSSALSHAVARAREKQYEDYNALDSNLNAVKDDDVKLPPPFLFQPQEVFMDNDWAEFFQNTEGRDYSSYLGKDGHLKGLSSYLDKYDNLKALSSYIGKDDSLKGLATLLSKEKDLNSLSSDLNSVRQQFPLQNMNRYGYPAPFHGLKGFAPSVQNYNGMSMPPHNLQNFAQSVQNVNGIALPGPIQAMKNLGRYFSQQVNGLKQSLSFQKPTGFGPFMGFNNFNGNRFPTPFSPPNFPNQIPTQNQIANSNAIASKLMDLQKQENRNTFLNQKYSPQSHGHHFPKPPSRDSVVMSPEEKLNMFLVLMKALGSIHTKKVSALEDLKSGLGHEQFAAGSTNRNDAEPLHIRNFVDRDNVMASDR